MTLIPYHGLIMVKPDKNRPVSRVVTLETVTAKRAGTLNKMPGQQPSPIIDETHFIQGTVTHVGLGYPQGSSNESSVPGMEPVISRQHMECQVGDKVLYSFNNMLNPVYELELPDGIYHLMREDAVMIITRK